MNSPTLTLRTIVSLCEVCETQGRKRVHLEELIGRIKKDAKECLERNYNKDQASSMESPRYKPDAKRQHSIPWFSNPEEKLLSEGED